jgi:GAF domain-containing protein
MRSKSGLDEPEPCREKEKVEVTEDADALDPFRAMAALVPLVSRLTVAELDGVITRILSLAATTLGLRKGTVALTDSVFERIHVLRIAGPSGASSERVTISLEANRDQTLYSAPFAHEDSDPTVGEGERAVIARPIMSGAAQHLGELQVVSSDENRSHGRYEDEVIAILASLAAVALERCQVQRDSLRLHEWLDAFSRVFAASRIPTTAADVDPLLQEIAESARRISSADFVVLYEYFHEDSGGDVRLPPTLVGPLRQEMVLRSRGVAIEHRRSVVFRLLQQQHPFYAENAIEDWLAAGLVDGPSREDSFFLRESVVASAGIPLRVEKECVGVLFLNYRRRFVFRTQFCSHLELFANQAALAIGNARFFLRSERYRRDLEALNRIGRELCSAVSRDIEQIAQLIDEKTQQVIPTKNFFVCLYNSAQDSFALPYLRDVHDTSSDLAAKLHVGLTGYVCRTGRSLIATSERIEQLFADGSAELVGKRAAVWLGAPLVVRDEVIGALVVQDYENQTAFGDEHRRLLEAVASQAAIAIDNYRLLDSGSRLPGEG